MLETFHRLARTAAARADFLESGRPAAAGVPDPITASWERSRAAGVDSVRPHSAFSAELDSRSLLARCAEPVLRQLGTDTSDLPLVIGLTDNHARVIRRIDTSPALGRMLDGVEFAPGFDYSESMMGTNGVGTVFESGRPFSVVGPEHFAEHLQSFACTGAPIIDPVTHRVEGVLDISSLSQAWSPLMHTLVKSAAADISRNLLLDRSQAQQALFETYLRTDTNASRQAVFAFGSSIMMANAAAQQLFSPTQHQLIRDHAAFMMSRRDSVRDTLELDDGRVVGIRGTRIVAGSDVAGLVVIAEALTSRADPPTGAFAEKVLPAIAVSTQETSRIAGGLSMPYEPVAGGRTPAWARACDELREALGRGCPILVTGESGSGRFTLVTEIFHARFPNARSIMVDAAVLVTEDDESGLGGTISAAHPEPTLYLIRNLDQATTAGTEALAALFSAIEASDSSVMYAATLSDDCLGSDLPFHVLLDHFDVAVAVPPLRLRTEDVPEVVSSVLSRLVPGRHVRLSPGALRVIRGYSWPRNVTQLREALEHALRRRPAGEIQEEDLPAYCLTSIRRPLAPIEAAERDVIVASLQLHHGNRVAAAAHLGMSRSGLYRKLKTYGIAL